MLLLLFFVLSQEFVQRMQKDVQLQYSNVFRIGVEEQMSVQDDYGVTTPEKRVFFCALQNSHLRDGRQIRKDICKEVRPDVLQLHAQLRVFIVPSEFVFEDDAEMTFDVEFVFPNEKSAALLYARRELCRMQQVVGVLKRGV